MVAVPDDQIWIVVTAFIISFILAVALGANDVANSFATSVGSKVLTLRQACILGSIFELVGAVLLGARVSDTIRKGIIDVTAYNDTPDLLLVGYISALTGAGLWLLVATVIKLPVSGTHSIVGSTIGFALVAKGADGIEWNTIGLIAGSWVFSPVLSGLVSVILFVIVRTVVLRQVDKLVAGMRLLPILYGFTIVVNAFSIFFEGPEQLYLDRIPLWGTFTLSFALGTLTALTIRIFFVPWQRAKIIAELLALKDKQGADPPTDVASNSYKVTETASENSAGATTTTSIAGETTTTSIAGETNSVTFNTSSTGPSNSPDSNRKSFELSSGSNSTQAATSSEDEPETNTDESLTKDPPEVSAVFSKLQILTAIFGSFAHGGNDVSNAIGPLVAVWLITTEGNVLQKAATPIWVLVYGGVGIAVGLWALGRRVIETLGSDLTAVTPSSAFTIEIGSALTVLIASSIGIPISTTHCKVGSVVFVGRVRSKDNVDWKIFGGIIIAWLVTLPAAGLVSAGVFYGLQHLVPPLGPPWAPTTTTPPYSNFTQDITTTIAG